MDQMKASERTKFKMDFRREMIDKAERRIEHEKSMIKNYKAQIKAMYPEFRAAQAREQEAARYNSERAQVDADMEAKRMVWPNFAGDFAKAMTEAGAIGYEPQ